MPGSTIVCRYDGTDITSLVLFADAQFESQMAAIPGSFQITIKDVTRTHSFTTGKELTLDVDGTRLFGGYVTQVSEKFAFPAVSTANVSKVTARQWVLRGVDYNILFDKLVLRNTADYLHHLPTYAIGTMEGALIRNSLAGFLDLPAGWDTITQVEDVVTGNPEAIGAWEEQGTTWRKQMEDFAQWGAVYYNNANKQLVFKAVEDFEAKWQFSDKPNRYPIPSGYSYKPTVGFREGEFVEDGTLIVNDAMVWGGSEWSNGIVFARRQNTASQTAHGRWQFAETQFGKLKSQRQVDERAKVIVDGTVTGSSSSGTRGLVNPQSTARVTWFDRNVPTDPNLSNVKSHLRPGDIVTFILYTMGTDLAHPRIMTLPLRSVRISFPNLDPSGKAYVQFEGYFGLQLSDPWWLWKFIRDKTGITVSSIIATANDSTTGSVAYGTLGSFTPTPAPDGSNKIFTIPYGYIAGTTEVYVNGLRYFAPANYIETDPVAGSVTMNLAPVSGDHLFIVARLLGG